ncbi:MULTISPECIES: ATPase, T2SS/T4P/T4SS family [unclassified Pseudovibrio]|uniref:ATPase, T2SS/T4P/T4SS family n=1 Tax=unclassified Pseudovibrio TaxID=2627060 RepID=UPI0007AEADDA|nr:MULTISPECIES: ATPase, T2SS/T4P/T4SS family [unclassified Pseudovibrio]KZK96150.1 Type IV secretion system protein VirB11 [Pseudovibrio sp. W74]KZL05194.1 Type IV secretion system protein VirB11 [Pseudovibrio sp. Ad14]
MSDALIMKLMEPLAELYSDPNVVELRQMRPRKIIVEHRKSDLQQIETPNIGFTEIRRICQALANYNGLKFSEDTNPNLSVSLPERHRFECLIGPSTQNGLSMAVRCKHPYEIKFEDLGLRQKIIDYIGEAMHKRWNIAISGSTNTGKTTFLNKLLGLLPVQERIVSCEDTPELEVERFWNGSALFAAREASQGAGLRTWEQLFNHKMRISPDRIIFSEISTENAFPALNALNTGAKGWMCTIHADRAEMVVERFQHNIDMSGMNLTKPVSEYFDTLVDVVFHITRFDRGVRHVTDIYEVKNNRYILKDGKLQ